MLRTPLCDLLGIESPIIQGSLGPWSSVELAAAVSNAAGLGSLGTALLSPEQNREQIARTREFTDKPFAVNHTLRPFNHDILPAADIVRRILAEAQEVLEQATTRFR